jgi:NAD(P)-dependent dehydrogenase (short-subunit alcohol dehydrogenase family)
MKRSNPIQPPALAIACAIRRVNSSAVASAAGRLDTLGAPVVSGPLLRPRIAALWSMPSRPVALVTGAAQRIGRSIALELATRGHDVAVHTRRSLAAAEETAQAVRALGARAVVLSADLDREDDARALVPATVEALGRIDVVVNNASTFEYDSPAPDSPTPFGYDALVAHAKANTGAPVLLAQALHQAIEAARRGADPAAASRQGCVVNLLDQKLVNPNPDYFSYTLSKAALQSATVMLAQALAPLVRVCAVAPGVTLVSGPMNEAEFAASHRMTPLARSSTPADVAQAVAFLASAPAVTGHTLVVDGGQHLWGQPRDVLFLAREQAGGA